MKVFVFSLTLLALRATADAREIASKKLVSKSSPNMKLRKVLAEKIMEKSRQLQYDQYNGNQYNGNQYNGNQYNGNQQQYNGNQQQDYNGNQQYNGNYNNNAYYGYVDNGDDNYNGGNGQAFQQFMQEQHAWVGDFSLKFQGCHRISQWNYETENEADERILTRNLVSFRLCPSGYCSSSDSNGCENGYGDYVVDLETFLEAYVEAKETYDEWMGDYQDGGNWYDANQYGGWDGDIEDYLQCQQSDIQIDADEMDNYWYGGNNQGEEQQQWDGNYYIGPYCSEQGGAISVGLYKDEECMVPAGNDGGKSIYYNAMGQNLPYSQSNMVDADCIPCSQPRNYDEEEDGEQSEVAEFCENLYVASGKCENELPYGTAAFPNSLACNFVGGLQVLRDDGTVLTTNRAAPGHVSGSNKAAAVFTSLFSVATVLLAAYVYYLKSKLDRASVNLGE